MSDSTPPLNWKWRIAQNLAKRAKRKTRQHPVTGYVAEHHLPSLKTREGIAATLALSALTDALREQNELQRRRVARLEQRAEQQRSLIEALVQFLVVFLLLISVGGYAAFNWAITEIGGRINAISSLPGMGWLLEGAELPEKPQGHRDGVYMPSVDTFAPLAIATPYLYDHSPPGAWDFTLINPKTDSTRVAIPSPCPGTIEDIGQTKRAGNYLWLHCSDGTRWFMAHLHRHQVAQDSTVQLGQALGLQGSTGNSTGDHVHAVIDPVTGDRTDRTATKPVLEEAFRFWKQGNQLIGNSTRPLPNKAIELVKQLEGLQLEAYPDGTDANGLKRWSIGYGTPSRPGEQITPAEADKRLQAHLAVANQRVSDLVTVPLTETQRTALISFEYNTGGLATSGLLRHLNNGNLQAAATAFEDWVYWVPHGQVDPEIAPGLVQRRKREQQIFLRDARMKAS